MIWFLILGAAGSIATVLMAIAAAAKWIERRMKKLIEEGVTRELREHMDDEERTLRKQRKQQKRLERRLDEILEWASEHTTSDTAFQQRVEPYLTGLGPSPAPTDHGSRA